ncbi:MAG: vitamin K epoxide reductase family protein, partial [Anaerolineales bacterium]
GLDSGGIAWPEIPGLQEHIADLVPIEEQNEQGTTPTAEAVNPEGNTEQEQAGSTEELENTDVLPPAQQPDLMGVNISRLSVRERVLLDPVGNTLSILVLIGMLLSIVGIAARWRTGPGREAVQHLHGYHLILILLGIGVAAYLTFVESTDTLAVCGPVGDCNTVQQSGYALLFGLLPVGVLGLVGYTGLLIAWSIARSGRGQSASFATIGFFALALLGTLFSIYLTFLEPFVIGATCMWCLSSAVIMTALAVLSTDPARSAFQAWRSQEGGTKAG